MAFRPLKSFFSTAEELLKQDLPTLAGALLTHLKSYEGLNTVYQHAGLNRGYFRAMLDNRNVGLGPLPKDPEYGTRQPEVTKRMMEAWNWLDRQGLLIPNDQQGADWFTISSEGEEYLNQAKRPVPLSPHPPRVSKSTTGPPRALLSYSWDDSEHQQWVTKFAERLQGKSGVEIIFDQLHLNPGDDKLHFMEHSSLPIYLQTRIGVNLSDEPYHEGEYEKLLRVLHGELIQPPPVAQQLTLKFDDRNSVDVRIECVGEGLIIKKARA